MRRQVCDTADGITLDLYIRAKHLSNERLKTAQFYDKQFVISYTSSNQSDELNAEEASIE